MKFLEVAKQHRQHDKYTNIPKRGTSQSAGYDFHLKETVTLQPNQTHLSFTDVKCRLGEDEVLMLYPRSSVGIKQKVILANTAGVIDSDYFENEDNDGNIGLPLHNYGDREITLLAGTRVAQGVVMNYVIAENDRTEGSRTGGFGSTDKVVAR